MAKKIHGPDPLVLADAYWRAQYLFFDRPGLQTSLSDLADVLDMHKNTAREVVMQLQDEGFLQIDEIGRAWLIKTDLSHAYHITRKIPYHLQMIYESGILQAVRKEFPGARAIVLFGSYRKGDSTEESDIDIAVEVADNQSLEIAALGTISLIGYRKNVPVNVHIFDRRHINLNLFANIANGIILDGFLEVHL